MREIKVTRWETEDGRAFDAKKDALDHEFSREVSSYNVQDDFILDMIYIMNERPDLVLKYINDIRELGGK